MSQSKPPYVPFYNSEETSRGSLLSRRYACKAAFSCEDWEEFKKQLQTLQDELREWLERRGKKATSLTLGIQAHPWIHGRVLEAIRRTRSENSALGTVLNQAEVSLHLYSEDEPVGELHHLSDKDGKPVAPAPL